MLYKKIKIYIIFNFFRNPETPYVEIDQYRNIPFHYTNRNRVQNDIHNIAFKQKEKAKKKKKLN